MKLIKVNAGKNGGSFVSEEIPVEELGGNKFKVLASPGLAMNIAKGDILEVFNEHTPANVIKRGGNFCIHIYNSNIDQSELDFLTKDIAIRINGSLDGEYMKNLAFSVPASSGLERIKFYFDEIACKHNTQWYFSNIYSNLNDIDDETLLNWWID